MQAHSTPTLLLAGLLGLAANAWALSSEGLPESHLKAYGSSLAAAAGNSQWQQLWKRTRDAGHFHSEGPQPRFTLPMTRIPSLVRQTLADADNAQPEQRTQVLYRRSFAPLVVGREAGSARHAICLWVDWRALPETTASNDGAAMGNVSLLLARPCE